MPAPRRAVRIQLPDGTILPPSRPELEPPQAPLPAAPPVTVNVERFFLVEKDCQVPRGSTYYTLWAGQTISSFGYDIDALIKMGAPLKPVPSRVTPAPAVLL